jgi:hypothetical protein
MTAGISNFALLLIAEPVRNDRKSDPSPVIFLFFQEQIPSARIVLSCNERERRGADFRPRL